MNFQKACEIAGYNPKATINSPIAKFKYYGYKDGKAIECETLTESKKYHYNDYVITNKEEIDSFWDARRKLEQKASNIFLDNLRQIYSDIPDDLYNLCFDEASDRGHSSGYDTVAEYLQHYVNFALNAIAISKR